MRLKDQVMDPYGGWKFFLFDANGVEVAISGSTRADLVAKVKSSLALNGYDVPKDIDEIIETQICLRNRANACWSSGLGDEIHSGVFKFLSFTAALVDGKKKSRARTAIATAVRKIAGCQGCGGTTTYTSGKNNLGRAGVLNKIWRSNKR